MLRLRAINQFFQIMVVVITIQGVVVADAPQSTIQNRSSDQQVSGGGDLHDTDNCGDIGFIADQYPVSKSSPDVYFYMGECYLDNGSLPEAIESFDQAISHGSEHPFLYMGRAWVYFDMGLYQKSVDDFMLYLKIVPEDRMAREKLADAYAAQEKYKEAIDIYETALIYKEQTFKEAYGSRNDGYSANVQSLQLKLAAAYYHLDRIIDAVDIYKKVLKRNENSSEAHNNLAWIYIDNDTVRDIDSARTHAMRAIEITRGRDVDVLDTMARVQFEQGMYKDAVKTMERSVKIAPDDEQLQKTLKYYRSKLEEQR